MKKITSKRRLIVALDLPTEKQALKAVKLLSPTVKIFKVGLELFCASGPGIIDKIHKAGAEVFLDLKFFDIPNTMAGAVATSAKSRPLLLNIHALAGPEAMARCAKAIARANKKTKLIAVTILTSFDKSELKKTNIKTPVEKTVKKLCQASIEAGIAGVVASPLEIKPLRKKFGNNFLIVTPGIRPTWAAKNDQKRIATPTTAIKDGADYIVVGRPILGADDPLEAAKKVQKEIKEADSGKSG